MANFTSLADALLTVTLTYEDAELLGRKHQKGQAWQSCISLYHTWLPNTVGCISMIYLSHGLAEFIFNLPTIRLSSCIQLQVQLHVPVMVYAPQHAWLCSQWGVGNSAAGRADLICGLMGGLLSWAFFCGSSGGDAQLSVSERNKPTDQENSRERKQPPTTSLTKVAHQDTETVRGSLNMNNQTRKTNPVS